MQAPPTAAMICPILIGRARPMAALDHFVEQVCDGAGQTMLISGEAGIGKSRLIAEAATYAARRGCIYLRGRCFETDRTFPYAPLIDLLRTHVAAFAAAHTESIDATLAELNALLPELDLPGNEPIPAAEPDPQQVQRHLFHTLLRLFTRLPGPLLIMIEDIHWSDEATLEYLLFLARRVGPHRIGLLLTYRIEDVPPALASLLMTLRREQIATELVLSPLSQEDVAALVSAVFDLSQPARPDFVEALYARTEGNPLFVEEVLSTLIAAGDIFFVGGAWDRKQLSELRIPHSVQVAVQRRLDRLSDAARDVVILAAIAGRRFDFALLQVLTSHDELTLVRLVKELIQAQLVVEESAEIFAFRHALTRDAVEADLLARERRALHRVVGEAIVRLYAGSLEAHLADIAHHFEAAEEWERVLDYARRAGDHARVRYAPRAAVEHYSYALDARQSLRLPISADLLRARGQMYEMLGEFDAARDDYQRTLDAAADDATRWQALLDLGWLWTGRDYERAGTYLQRALQLARGMGDARLLAGTLNRLGNWYANIEQPHQARDYHAEALTLFKELGDAPSQAATLDLLGTTGFVSGEVVAGMDYYERAITLFRELDDRQGLVSCLAMSAMRGISYVFDTVICPVASREACVRDADEALRIAREISWRGGEAAALMYSGLACGPRGDYARALVAARECRRIADEIEHHQWALAGRWTLGAIYLDLLQLGEACAELEQAVAQAQAVGHAFSVGMGSSFLASAHITRGNLREAEAVLAGAGSPHVPPRTLAARLVARAWAELELARGQPAVALGIVEELIRSATVGQPATVIPNLWRLRGAALAALGRKGEAVAALQAASSAAKQQGARALLWRIHVLLGQILLATHRRDEADEAFAAACATIAELADDVQDAKLGAAFLHNALAQLPRRSAPSPRRLAKRSYDGLTEREREVAVLISEGKTNRQIAEALILSQRTVQVHITNIMGKLDFTSRAQIAAWVVAKGLAQHEF